ncbi:MAG: signal peptidase I [Ruminococcaceae bacterium]|nr:signal peptidase I [Oscillospiraceae bacterium]
MDERDLIEYTIPDEKQSEPVYTEFYDWMTFIFSCVLCFLILFTVLARVITVDGESMLPTLQDRNMLLVSDVGYTPQYEDIVIVYAPSLYNKLSNDYGKTIVKRVIGLPGDKIRIDFGKGIVYRNGEALEEPYTNTLTNIQQNFPNNKEVTVPENRLFVLGDNRNDSKDSRSYDIGMVDVRCVIGKSLIRVWPFDKLGTV